MIVQIQCFAAKEWISYISKIEVHYESLILGIVFCTKKEYIKLTSDENSKLDENK